VFLCHQIWYTVTACIHRYRVLSAYVVYIFQLLEILNGILLERGDRGPLSCYFIDLCKTNLGDLWIEEIVLIDSIKVGESPSIYRMFL
jgi:hypothetical protein